jgi:RNA polymerase sigma-70 factor (ECF subfamily)
MNQKALLEDALRGKRAACDRLARMYIPITFRYFRQAWRVTPSEAEELTQETFAEAWSSLKYCRGTQVKAWFLTIARRVAWKKFKTQAPKAFVSKDSEDDDPIAELPSTQASQEELVLMKAQFEQLRELFVHLRPEFREVLYLYYLEELTVEELAHSLEVPMGTAKTWLQRARANLKQEWRLAQKSTENRRR